VNPLASLKAIWNSPKKRPWLIAGGGAAAAAGLMAMKRPVEPSEQVGEETVAQSVAPIGGDASAAYPEYQYGGTLPPVYALGGMGGDFDPGMAETDLSGIWSELDNIAAGQGEAIGIAVAEQTATLRAQAKRQKKTTARVQQKVQQQAKTNRQQRRQIARLQTRVKQGPKPKPRSVAKPRVPAKGGRR
jgi:hypothetical protein